jgi:GPH family glycoside/pentoside/hexuronide:cation symporter
MVDGPAAEDGKGGRNEPTDARGDEAKTSLPFRIVAAYSFGQLGWAVLINIISFWLVFLYSGEFRPDASAALVAGIGLSVIAGGGRVFDAVIDPLVARYSDQATFDSGRRTPFMIAGALPAGICCVLVFVPPTPTASALNFVWLAVTSVGFYLFLTVYATPYAALLPEISKSPGDRVNLATGIAVTFALGLAISAQASGVWNLLIDLFGLSRIDGIRLAIVLLSGFSVVCMYVPVVVIDEHEYSEADPSTRGLFDTLRAFSRNQEFLSYLVALFAFFGGLQIIVVGMSFYATELLGFGETLVGTLLVTVIVTWFLVYPFVNALAKRFGKKLLMRLSFLSLGAMFCFITVLGIVPIPRIVQAFGLSVLTAVPLAFIAVLDNAILGDIAKLDTEESGEAQEGMFFGSRLFVQKMGQSFALFIFPALTIYDTLGIRLSGVIGAVLCLVAFVIFGYYREEMITESLASYEPGTETE